MSAGPVNMGSNDYPATIAIWATDPSGASRSAINFPCRISSSSEIVINNPDSAQTDNTEFYLTNAGIYRATWHISVDEPCKWTLWMSTAVNPGINGQI
jgi:hypothetical protein